MITGASSGIGLGLAEHYAKAGWEVIACGRNEKKLRTALTPIDPSIKYCVFDINNRQQVLTETKALPSLDLVILNAGICEYIDLEKKFDSELMERVIRTNVIGVGYCIEATLPAIRKGGQVALISSAASALPFSRAEAYGASKAALDYIARALSIDLSSVNVTVSLIRPGFVDTPLTRKNDFPMPGIISCEKACDLIAQGIRKRKSEITFPTPFWMGIRLLSLFPKAVWRQIAIKLRKNTNRERGKF